MVVSLFQKSGYDWLVFLLCSFLLQVTYLITWPCFPTFSKYLSPDRLEPSGVTFKCLNSLPRTQSGLGTHVQLNMHLYEGGCVCQAGYCSFMFSDWKERVNIWLKGGGEIYYVIKHFSMEVYYCPPKNCTCNTIGS